LLLLLFIGNLLLNTNDSPIPVTNPFVFEIPTLRD
jgi:hypothetical protein